jgi:hypothetical protein
MGEIALNLMMNCAAKEDSFHDLELATFAGWQRMTKEFRTNYQKRWHAAKLPMLGRCGGDARAGNTNKSGTSGAS